MEDICKIVLQDMVWCISCVHCSSFVWLSFLLEWWSDLQKYFKGILWPHYFMPAYLGGFIDSSTWQINSLLFWILEHLWLTSHRCLHCIYYIGIYATNYKNGNSWMYNCASHFHKSDLLFENIWRDQFLGADDNLSNLRPIVFRAVLLDVHNNFCCSIGNCDWSN